MTKSHTIINPQDIVQSCISTVSFPESIDAVLDMVDKHQRWIADIDTLLSVEPNHENFWSSPKWLTQGDIIFFYYTKSSRQRITKLLQQAKLEYNQEDEVVQELVLLLERSQKVASLYSGTIFACANVSSSSEYLGSELCHFQHRFFAPVCNVHIFNKPLTLEQVTDYITITQGTITPLYGKQVEGIRTLLFNQNQLPEFLGNAKFGGTFRDVNQENWYLISCVPNARFIHEAQIRAYLVDYLLKEIKDSGLSLLEECRCFRGGRLTGIADYFIKLDDKWIPVEAKLNILTERDILSQIAKYTRIDSFKPTKGQHRDRTFNANKLQMCMIVDQSGVYIVLNNNFFECSPRKPRWKREHLNPSIALSIREWIIDKCL